MFLSFTGELTFSRRVTSGIPIPAGLRQTIYTLTSRSVDRPGQSRRHTAQDYSYFGKTLHSRYNLYLFSQHVYNNEQPNKSSNFTGLSISTMKYPEPGKHGKPTK